MTNKILLLDSHSLINRAFYALPPLSNNDGVFTNAITGYLMMLNRLIVEEKPTHICAVFDCHEKTFRHKMYEMYKGTRKPMPEALVGQVPILQELLQKLGIKILFKPGYEADDIMGTLAKRFNDFTIIVSGDKDTLQLVDENTNVFLTKKGITEVIKYTPELLKEHGHTASQVIEFKGLAGDSSDNIPGCPGVGEKTAWDLLAQYNDIDGIYANIDEIKGKLKEKLEVNKDLVYLSKQLATIDTNADIDCTLDDMAFSFTKLPLPARDLLNYLQLKKIIEMMDSIPAKLGLMSDTSTDNEEYESTYTKKLEVESIKVEDVGTLESIVNSIPKGSKVDISIQETEIVLGHLNKEIHIPITISLLDQGISDFDAMATIKPLFSKDYIKVLYDVKHMMHLLEDYDITIEKPYEDVLLKAYLNNNTKVVKSNEQLVSDYSYSTDNIVAATLDLNEKLTQDLEKKGISKLYYEVELPLIEVLYSMEKVGFRVDLNVLNELDEKYSAELKEIEQDIYAQAGEVFNINSTKQLGNILFEKLNLDPIKKNKRGFSVDADTLEELDHPIVTSILRYRELFKLKSTYIDGMRNVVKARTGKVNTSFNQCITATGRLSSTEPNLQNIPVRRAEGKEIRRMFIPSDGSILISADYSQIELRLLAHFSKDPNLIEAYNEGIDIHALTASRIFATPLEQVTSFQRSSAKAVNFGIIYGISGFGLAKNAGVSRKTASKFIEQYFVMYPNVKGYMDSNIAKAKEQGYLSSLLGRIRYFPELKSPKYTIRAFGERAAMNMPLQGSASDIIKLAMLKVYNWLKEKNLKSKIILQVHDELILDVPLDEVEEVKIGLINIMESVAQLRVPLIVNVSSGSNWYEAK